MRYEKYEKQKTESDRMRIGSREFDTKNRTYIMGILNVTPDSFSDGGCYQSLDQALFRVQEMLAEGVDLIDIGGESTRPGYTSISVDEEIERVTPVIERIRQEFDIPISLDTYHSRTARAGIAAGTDMINDIWGLKYDADMAGVIAEAGAACCLMHNRKDTGYTVFMEDVAADLAESIHIAKKAGILEEQIILDPGVGFAKSYEQNLEVIHHLKELHMFGYPLLLGASRKSVIGNTLALPVEERLEGTLALSVLAVTMGCSFVRVHDIRENVRAVRMAEAVLHSGK